MLYDLKNIWKYSRFFCIKSVNKKITIEKSIKRIKIGTFHYTTN